MAAADPLIKSSLRTGVAFHYAAAFSPAEQAWYSKFELLVTGAILSPLQSKKLQSNGTKLIAYEWMSGYYPGDPVSAPAKWQQAMAPKVSQWALNDTPLPGGAAAPGRTALWYDFGDDQLLEARAQSLAARLTEAGYHGFFFDTPGFEHLPAKAQEAFRSRHPGADYNERQGLFLAALRRALPAGKIIFLNQGYRHAFQLLPHADMDLSESAMTALGPKGSTLFRPWHDAAKPWESVRTPMYDLILPALRKFPKVRMVHVNYAAGHATEISRALHYSCVLARIFGHDAYLIVPSSSRAEVDPIYFTDLGSPEDYWREEPSGAVWRRFERGVLAANSTNRPVTIPSLSVSLPEPLQGYVFRRDR